MNPNWKFEVRSYSHHFKTEEILKFASLPKGANVS